MDFISNGEIEREFCPGALPGGVCYGCAVPGCPRDIPFPRRARVPARRKPVAAAPVAVADPLADLNSYASQKFQQSLDQLDRRTAQVLREQRHWTLARCDDLAAPTRERMIDAKAGMADGLFGMEVLAEAELRNAQAEVPLVQVAQDRIIAAAVCRAISRARLIRRTSDPARIRRYTTADALSVIAICIQTGQCAGRRACTRDDDPDSDSANTIGRSAVQFVMEKPSTLCRVDGFLC